jgi:bifunctional polynucleotide phosphatase/kinase
MQRGAMLKIGSFRFRKKIAAFDFDHTLVKPKDNKTYPKDVNDWEWLRPNVVEVLQDLYRRKYCIIVFTNQTKLWKADQIKMVMEQVQVPCMICIAFDPAFRKPSAQMFKDVVKKDWDKEASFFVGDALGRKGDWSDTDKLFAKACGLVVKTPEEMFGVDKLTKELGERPCVCMSRKREIVVMVGYPGSGKTTLALATFKHPQYVVIHGDDYKSSTPKMIAAARIALDKGVSVVFDATNPSREKRAEYINLAKEYGIGVRCVHVDTSFEESLARNNKRDVPVPRIVYNVYKKKFVAPDVSEGCSVVEI